MHIAQLREVSMLAASLKCMRNARQLSARWTAASVCRVIQVYVKRLAIPSVGSLSSYCRFLRLCGSNRLTFHAGSKCVLLSLCQSQLYIRRMPQDGCETT
jgi:methylaspartate ammonia-lyase